MSAHNARSTRIVMTVTMTTIMTMLFAPLGSSTFASAAVSPSAAAAAGSEHNSYIVETDSTAASGVAVDARASG